jgi:hypothetical protein
MSTVGNKVPVEHRAAVIAEPDNRPTDPDKVPLTGIQ